MSEAQATDAQAIQPNTWTPLLGTDVELLIDGVPSSIHVEREAYANARGGALAQFTIELASGEKIVLRAPVHAVTWVDMQPVDNRIAAGQHP